MKEARREELYKSLETQQLSQQQLQLMYSTSKLGHKETLRERLKRSISRQKAGIALSVEEQHELFQQKDHPDDADVAMAENDNDGNDDNEPKKSAAAPTVTAKAVPTKVAADKAVPTPVETEATSNGKKRRKKNRTKQALRAVQETTLQAEQVANVKHTDVPSAGAEQTSSSGQSTFDRLALADTGDEVTSQNAAMTKLEALRRKNEEKRRQKEALRAQPSERNEPKQEEEAVEVNPADVYVPQPIVLKSAAEMRDLSKQTKLSYKTTLVQLKRKPEIQMARMQLPVCSSEQEIMEAISDNDVVILCGETGSGKTTQVPQFLYEAGYGHPEHKQFSGRVGVTQPRRVAAVSTAKRVAEELNVEFGAPHGHVGYQIRYDAEHVGEKTRIKFMTDGILLKEIQQDFLLRQYSILLLDEAHERNVNTDILIGLLSRIAPLRAQMAKEELEAFQSLATDQERAEAPKPIQPLKLVIMSATLRVEDFTKNQRLFPTPPPVLRVDARQYPVTVHFNKRTELDDYVGEAFSKVVKIHKKLPEGGVLVFLTGQREILQLCRKLRRAYSKSAKGKQAAAKVEKARELLAMQKRRRAETSTSTGTDRILREHDDIEEEADLEDTKVFGDDDVFALNDEDDEDKSDSDAEDEDDDELAVPYMHVLPLYSLLPNDEQMKVFDAPPEGHRLVVVATNVAETSLTIPGIKYVVDAGRTKERVFDLANGISSFEIQWISKASADQRAGRAGRTGPGHCYRLYSSAVYDTEFQQFSSPEILCQPIEDLVLQMKAMGIHNVLQFPFPTPPERQAVQNALATLVNLGAISPGDSESITALGRVLVKFPVAARFAKMLLLAKQMGLLEYTIAIVAALSGHSPFIHALDRKEQQDDAEEKGDNADGEDSADKDGQPEDEMEKEWREAEELRKHAQWIDHDSDVLSLLRAAGAYAYTGGSGQFCRDNHLHEKTMQNMLKLRQQLTRIVNTLYEGEDEEFSAIELSRKMPPPDDETQVVLRQIVAAGFLDNVGKRVPPGTITEGSKIERNCAYLAATGAVNEPVYIHPHSSVFSPDPARLPQFVVYQHVQRSTRAYLKTVTAVEPAWLAAVGQNTPLCSFSQPLTEPAPFYDADRDEVRCYAKPQFGLHQWSLPPMVIAFPDADRTSSASPDRYRWFAKFLLDGVVFDELRAFALVLKEPSQTLLRKKFDKKIQLLVTKLQSHGVASRRALTARWRNDRRFLHAELRVWVREAQHATFDGAWIPMVKRAVTRQA